MSGAALPEEVRTPRLLLRPFGEADIPGFVPLVGEWEVARWLGRVPHPYTERDGREWVDLAALNRADRAAFDLLAVRLSDGRPVGSVGLRLDRDRPDGGELGYWVGRPHQRSGYGLEMVRAMLGAAFGPLGLTRVWAATDPRNAASQALLLRAGFLRDGERLYDLPARGRTVTAPCFDLTAGRWRTLQETAS
ncbi:GNAT family N-acetyltransferase [Azospirillum thermophilum]|uniref:N-acetyltransferase domain-containing protein n=1 Tax=Azospirillum thermophilum TaxID=2202148 RepID=A0A2S2CN67_9PROT|nr:GNAT family N-acetyltransferase [Azospirillum thermophilum]AWK85916.1 hypothetical protein DEW08_06260 [Azospirillum thermophilum]